MAVKIILPLTLMPVTGWQKEIEVQASNLMEALEALIERFGDELRGRLFEGEGKPRRFLNFYVNGKNVRFLRGLETPLRDGDEVTILPSVSGG
ncbi:MoaD family protein [Candidatus Bathyarchaeota archaeon]|nr:MoaD family protein [Candidatus Bathyarchaeota archaeon]